MAETKWLDTETKITYRDLFNIIQSNELLNSIMNPDKLIEASFSVTTSLFAKNNGKSPYDNLKTNSICYIENGDAVYPQYHGNKLICHICNDIGAWGKGFVLAVSKRWDNPEKEYKKWANNKFDEENKSQFQLGNNQYVKVEPDITVVNMVAQRGIFPIYDTTTKQQIPPIRYDALRACLNKVAGKALTTDASVHLPKIGTGLAGGDWDVIEKIITECLVDKKIKTFVYLWDE